MLNKLIFDFDSDNITIFYKGRIVFKQPSAIVVTKNLYPAAIMYGKEAADNELNVSEEQMFILPIKKGAIAHFDGVKLLIKSILRGLKIKLSQAEVCVLISCCLDIEQKKDIERAFIGAGCSDVYLLERVLVLNSLTTKYHTPFVCYIGGEESDVAILQDKKIISGYSLDIGKSNINNMLNPSFEENYRIKLTYAESQKALDELVSLYADDISRVEIVGKDTLSAGSKRISICSKDIYYAVEHVYLRIIKLLEGALMASPGDIVQQVADNGIIFAGAGAQVEGFAEYVHKKLKVPPIIIDSQQLFLQECFFLISNEEWLCQYLGIN